MVKSNKNIASLFSRKWLSSMFFLRRVGIFGRPHKILILATLTLLFQSVIMSRGEGESSFSFNYKQTTKKSAFLQFGKEKRGPFSMYVESSPSTH